MIGIASIIHKVATLDCGTYSMKVRIMDLTDKSAPIPPVCIQPDAPVAEPFWLLEGEKGWLFNAEGRFTRDANSAWKFPTFERAEIARRNLLHPLFMLKSTEHKMVKADTHCDDSGRVVQYCALVMRSDKSTGLTMWDISYAEVLRVCSKHDLAIINIYKRTGDGLPEIVYGSSNPLPPIECRYCAFCIFEDEHTGLTEWCKTIEAAEAVAKKNNCRIAFIFERIGNERPELIESRP